MCVNGGEAMSRQSQGLTVREGQLLLEGQPYSGIGANYFSLFYRTLKDPSDKSYEDGLRQLSEAQIPFVRFMACGFWPVDWDIYLRDRETYFKRLDTEAQGMFVNGIRAKAMSKDEEGKKKQTAVMTNGQFTEWCLKNTHLYSADKI